MAKKRKDDDWLTQSLAAQAKRDRELKQKLAQDTDGVRKQKQALASILDLSDLPEPDDEEPIPDLFAEERLEAQRRQSELTDFGNDADSRRQSDLELARNLFGTPPNKKKKGR